MTYGYLHPGHGVSGHEDSSKTQTLNDCECYMAR